MTAASSMAIPIIRSKRRISGPLRAIRARPTRIGHWWRPTAADPEQPAGIRRAVGQALLDYASRPARAGGDCRRARLLPAAAKTRPAADPGAGALYRPYRLAGRQCRGGDPGLSQIL